MGAYASTGGVPPSIAAAVFNGGNQFASPMSIGTADANQLTIMTNGTTALTIDTSQAVTFAGALTFSGAVALSSTLSVAGVATFANGAAAAPSIAFTNSATTGWFRASAGEMALSLAGTQSLSWKSAQMFAVDSLAAAATPFYTFSADPDTGMCRIGANDLVLATNGTIALEMKGADVVCGSAAIATSATSGFFWVPGCAGAATGTPANTFTGRVPLVFDTTNGRLYAYYSGAWKYGAIAT